MEHHHYSSSSLPFFLFSLIIFILFISQLLKLLAKKSKVTSNKKEKLPPGPWTLPLIGSIHHLVGKSLPHHCMRDLAKKYGPLMHLKLGEASIMVVSSPEVAKEVFKTHDINFAERPRHLGADILTYGSTNIATARYGGYWKQLRRICSMELLSPKRVSSFKSIREEEVMNLIIWISDNNGSCVNLSEKVASLTSAITARAIFGEKCKYQEEFISLLKSLGKIVERVFVVFSLFPSHTWLHCISGVKNEAEKVHKQFDIVIENIIKDKIKRMKNNEDDEEKSDKVDLLSILLNIVEDHGAYEYPMTTNNVKAIIFDLFGAGIETSSAVIEWTISELMKNPEAMARAQEEVRKAFGIKGYSSTSSSLEKLPYLKAVIKETMRLHPPFPLLLPRECRETCEINGYTIAAGSQVIVNAWAIGRDPNHWGGEEDAERFRPERFLECSIDYKGSDVEFIPFGAGRRICPGIYFAVSSIEICVAQLLYYFDWKVPKNGDIEGELDMTEYFGSTVRRKNDLILVPIPWNSSNNN
ncbi:desmethyl-deoxy-podophyllotoxin synthase-like [Arachis stenosperma]|uniref:desmethyl-deoxy-podophyllotoxin synthase-like n=1 Tax=Arachis stenosperma TaxID=217475 RepID=UPI0025AC6174|nr:desmethyl-deoxy-podophyllotoxin synthase-like [Arachis stenosperma]